MYTGIYRVPFISHQRKKRMTHSPLPLETVVVHAKKECSNEWANTPPATESTIAPGKVKCQSARVIFDLIFDGERGGQRGGWTHA